MEKGFVGGEEVLMTNQKSAELPEPCIGALDDPAAFVPPELSSILMLSELVV